MSATTKTYIPGPWTVRGPSAPGLLHDDGGDYAIVANGHIIAEVFRRVSRRQIEPVEANARLIAAAPALLEAARHALAICEAEAELRGDNDTDDYQGGAARPVADMLRAAMAKVEGAKLIEGPSPCPIPGWLIRVAYGCLLVDFWSWVTP